MNGDAPVAIGLRGLDGGLADGPADGPRPADPFDALVHDWGDAYSISLMGDGSIAVQRRDDGTVLEAARSPEEAAGIIRADYGQRPVPRDAGGRDPGASAGDGYPPGVSDWLDAHEGATATSDGAVWHVYVPLSEGRHMTRGPLQPRQVLDMLTWLNAAASGCRRVEQVRPGWLVRVSIDGTWAAAYPRGSKLAPLAAHARSEDELLEAIDQMQPGPVNSR